MKTMTFCPCCKTSTNMPNGWKKRMDDEGLVKNPSNTQNRLMANI